MKRMIALTFMSILATLAVSNAPVGASEESRRDAANLLYSFCLRHDFRIGDKKLKHDLSHEEIDELLAGQTMQEVADWVAPVANIETLRREIVLKEWNIKARIRDSFPTGLGVEVYKDRECGIERGWGRSGALIDAADIGGILDMESEQARLRALADKIQDPTERQRAEEALAGGLLSDLGDIQEAKKAIATIQREVEEQATRPQSPAAPAVGDSIEPSERDALNIDLDRERQALEECLMAGHFTIPYFLSRAQAVNKLAILAEEEGVNVWRFTLTRVARHIERTAPGAERVADPPWSTRRVLQKLEKQQWGPLDTSPLYQTIKWSTIRGGR